MLRALGLAADRDGTQLAKRGRMKSGIRRRAELGSGRLRRPKILLAEYSTGLRQLLTDVLELEGYEVVQARNGYDVLVYAACSQTKSTERPVADLLIADSRLPDLSGLDVVDRLRRSQCLPTTIVMSGTLTQDEVERACPLGAGTVLRKPFSLEELTQIVADSLHNMGYGHTFPARSNRVSSG